MTPSRADRVAPAVTPARLLVVILAVLWAAPAWSAPAFPFGEHRQPYADGALRLSVPEARADRQTAAFYDLWKAAYLRAGCGPDQYYVKADTDSGATVVSEGQGYGMLIVAMAAGHDPEARTIFDGLHRYNLAHPSGVEGALTSWAQDAECRNVMSNDSATDGDLDAAYALLIAHKQWGSDGAIDYREDARRIVAAIRRANVNPDTKLTNLGDWVTVGGPRYRFGTRSSDWMPGHFRAFADKVKRSAWRPVLDAHLDLIEAMQDAYAEETGLLPDFVSNTHRTARPAPAGYLEGATDGRYSYNACRVPWRIGIDAAISGDSRSTAAARRISAWIRKATAERPRRIRDGYRLNGAPTADDNTMAFVAPFAVAAMVDPDGQVWLDRLWEAMVRAEPQGYYPDSLKLLSMLAVSRNWLIP